MILFFLQEDSTVPCEKPWVRPVSNSEHLSAEMTMIMILKKHEVDKKRNVIYQKVEM